MPTARQTFVASITRRYPFYSGCGRLANHRAVQRLAGPSDEIAWARVHGGYRVAAPLSDHVGRAIFYSGELDRKITWVCSRLVRPGDTVLDIGANLGLVSFILSSMVGTSGQVHAFEPNPRMQTLIEQAMARNGVRNIQLHRMALGARDDELTLTVPRENAGAASLVTTRRATDDTEMVVSVRTLSSVMADLDTDHIRLVKIDVEGFEPEVLAGAADIFARRPPDSILFELNDSHGPLCDHPTVRALSDLGYGFFSLPLKLVRMGARRLDPRRVDQPVRGHDFVAARLGPVYDDIARRLRAG
jgi:FkbM family methyltransferase